MQVSSEVAKEEDMSAVQLMERTPVAPWQAAATQHANNSLGSLLRILHINGGIVIRPQETQKATINAQPLSKRESEVLALVAEGNSNKLIADRLSISERTVQHHLTLIMSKLNAYDRTHAVVSAVRLGWLAI
jgi:DNA-binding NarL/FixJ family response regulator